MGFKYEEVRRDYEEIKKLCGADPNDLCGALCNTQGLFKMLENPCKKQALKMYLTLIEAYSYKGSENSFSNEGILITDEEVLNILEKYI